MIKNMKKYIASLIMVLFLSSCFSMNGTQYIQKSNVYKYDISLKISKDLYESFNQKSNHVLKDFDIVELKSIIDLSKYKLNDSEFKSKSVWVKAKLETNQELDNLIKNITQLDGVFDVELNSEFKVEAYQQKIINNPKLVEQWYMQNANIPNAWSWMEGNEYLAGGDPSIVIAVIDTGVDYLHEDLRDNMWINYGEIPNNGIDDDNNGFIDDIHGVNVVSDERFHSGNPMDDHGHGTHVAGIIASSNNYIGTVGVAYNSKIMAIKAATASGTLFNTDIAEAIMYAYNNGADIINMSFGGGTASNLVQEALSIAYTNTILVASAGNSGLPNQPCPKGSPVYPAAYPYVIGVMSHNQNDNPSSFSNWDCKAYNYLEYDVYAPGEGIISTLPNNQYAAWSGTSMAAPIVSGIAALLRTHFTDFNEYPNKFIMGQIIGNADFDEIKFSKHGQVNALSALTNRPVPNVNLFETYVFDSEDINENNNGDRIIDSGETIAVGFDINNRWGKAKNTTITLDSKSPAGIDNPWIQFVNNQYVFGDIGYLSNKDNNKIWVNQELVGFEDPLLIHILETTPNDMVIKINVTITYENAMDESDTNIYTKKDSFTLQVRNGFLLPRVIEEDMVLNSDNYYIISDSTLIAAGVTVEITEGTKIQFGTAAMEEPYKVVLKPSLTVRGTLHISGSKDNLVELFPSELLYDIPVVIDRSDNGLIIMEYAKITNGYLNISSGSHLILDQNTDFFQYPRDYNGTLYMDSVNNIVITADLIENSIFRNLNNVVIDSSLKNNMFYNNAVQLLLGNNNLQTYFDYYKMQYIHPSYRPSSRYYHNNLFLSNNKFIYNAISSSGGSYVPSEFLIGSNSGDFKDNTILNNFTILKP
jgi:subtilisin family serine protease